MKNSRYLCQKILDKINLEKIKQLVKMNTYNFIGKRLHLPITIMQKKDEKFYEKNNQSLRSITFFRIFEI